MTTQQNPQESQSLRPFFTLWVGQAFSLLGSQLVQFALIWWLTQQTGSATVLAVASIVGLLPQVILGPFAGVFVDRWNRRWVLFWADGVVALASLALAYLYFTGSVEIWQVYAALFIRALGGSFHFPAMAASTSLMVPQQKLTQIQGLNQALRGGMNIASAPLGALLVTLLPMQSVLLIDVLTAALAMTAVLLVKIPQPERDVAAQEQQSSVSSYWSDLRAGFQYIINWRGLLILGALAMLINMILGPTNSFLPLLVTDYFQGTAWHLSALEAAFGIGVLVGGLLLGVWGGFKRRIFTSLMGVIGIGLGIMLIGLTPASMFPLAVFGALLSGAMGSLADGPLFAIFQAKVDPALQGRVFTLIGSAASAMTPLGLAVAGPLADVIGVRAWFIGGGLITLLFGVVAFFVPTLTTIEQQREDHRPAADKSPAALPTTLESVESV